MSESLAGLLRTPIATAGVVCCSATALATRTEIEGWIDTIDFLSTSATAYREAGDRIESAADAHVQQLSTPGGSDWEGDAADAARESAYADRGVVYRAADHMRDMAKVANAGAQSIGHARDRVLDAISEAEGDDFQVHDNLTVTDTRRYTSSDTSVYLARKAAAESHHGLIAMRAGALVSEDADVGAKLQNGAAVLSGMAPLSWGPKQSPAQPISNGDDAGDAGDTSGGAYTGREIAEELGRLRDGRRTGIKEVDTEDDIFDLWEKYSPGGVRVPLPDHIADKTYDRVVLEDGTTIGVRQSDPHGPTLDVGYPPGVDGPNKIHFPEAPPPPPAPPTPPPPAGDEAPFIAPPPKLPVVDHPPVEVPPTLLPPWAPGAGAPALGPPDLPNTDGPILAGIGTVLAGIGALLATLANPRGVLGG